jgi:hypothetical protein
MATAHGATSRPGVPRAPLQRPSRASRTSSHTPTRGTVRARSQCSEAGRPAPLSTACSVCDLRTLSTSGRHCHGPDRPAARAAAGAVRSDEESATFPRQQRRPLPTVPNEQGKYRALMSPQHRNLVFPCGENLAPCFATDAARATKALTASDRTAPSAHRRASSQTSVWWMWLLSRTKMFSVIAS